LEARRYIILKKRLTGAGRDVVCAWLAAA
jgi:hypothetical protein